MKYWRALWFDDELISIELKEIPEKVLAVAREENASEAAIWRAANNCVEAPIKTPTGQRGHGCFIAADSIDKALVEARKRHPTKVPQ
jgi:hypothetical protein